MIRLELATIFTVACDVAGSLVSPEFRVGGGSHFAISAAMTVPEATVNEDDLSVCGQYQIGFAGQ